jgi:nucleoid DNA-binding protein
MTEQEIIKVVAEATNKIITQKETIDCLNSIINKLNNQLLDLKIENLKLSLDIKNQ